MAAFRHWTHSNFKMNDSAVFPFTLMCNICDIYCSLKVINNDPDQYKTKDDIFRRVPKIEKKTTIIFVLPIQLQLDSHWTDFLSTNFFISAFFASLSRKFILHYNLTRNNGNFT